MFKFKIDITATATTVKENNATFSPEIKDKMLFKLRKREEEKII